MNCNINKFNFVLFCFLLQLFIKETILREPMGFGMFPLLSFTAHTVEIGTYFCSLILLWAATLPYLRHFMSEHSMPTRL